MKKGILIVIFLAMLSWAVYDFIGSDEKPDAQESDMSGSTTNGEKENSEDAEETLVGLKIGNHAPDFQLQTLNGEQAKLSDYRGSRVMLNFWATWCPPCRAEMPDMERFHQVKDVVILAVNLTETEPNVQQIENFVSEYNLTFPILLDEQIEVATQYMIQPIPSTFMIDSNGVIQYKAFGAMNYGLMVNEFEKME